MIDPALISTFDKETLLRHLLYKLTPEQRRELMREYPGTYNRVFGRDYVVVHHATSGDQVRA